MEQELRYGDLLKLQRWNTPTIYNGWEQITARNTATECFNLDEVHDFMPQMGPMVGYAVTLVVEPSRKDHAEANPSAVGEYRSYIASIPGPKIVVVQDLDKPGCYGSFWGEVNGAIHRALGCLGTITDGAIRDVDEMTNSGFKAIARRLCVGRAFVTPVKWGCDVEVFGCRVQSGQLVHADKHGFLAIPPEDESRLLEAAVFMDGNECETLIPAARYSAGRGCDEILAAMKEAGSQFRNNAMGRFGKKGEW
jgi:4-hydroxy-4-methyl-2-oxoglutarate aldolase